VPKTESPKHVWLLRAADLDEYELFLKGGFFGFGDQEDALDASSYSSEEELNESFRKRWKAERVQSYYWWIANEIKVGDEVYLCYREVVLEATGVVTGKYVFSDTKRDKNTKAKCRDDFAHTISAEWRLKPSRHLDLYDETGYKWGPKIRKLEEKIGSQERLLEIKTYFMQTHPLNLISYGPPGTGKTYHAITRAVAICTNRSVEFVKKREGGRKDIEIQFSQLCEEGRIEMITFHQSYDYTDFISGIRPNLSEKNVLGYELTKGPLYRVAKKASQELIDSAKEGREPHPYVLIIDEINRGNVAKIFGELITLIDEDKRSNPNVSSGIGIPLLYDEKGAKPFTLPSNLYIIGTMNSSDRSVQKLDSALRRRFYFDAVDPDPSLLKTEGSRLADFLAQLNLRLEAKRPNSGCQIGHAWFMRKGSPVKGDADLVEILNEKVFPLLQEWFWDDEKAIRAIFLNDSVSYLSSSGRLSFDGLKTDKLEAFFEEFIKQSPKK
jgi:5-methylcytosine-specific restriction endonuclease McrBC GTP-binding regulatory subunit McrB